MKKFFNQLTISIEIELQSISMDTCDISTEESYRMIEFLQKMMSDLRGKFMQYKFEDMHDEIAFFKEMKPEILGMLLYFNKIHHIELKRPMGSNETQKEYYDSELRSITCFFERHLDFYQYYRSKSTYLDEYYFVRGKVCPKLCADSFQYIRDHDFSTGYDYKIAKINCNEMLRIYLNKKLQSIDRICSTGERRQKLRWTASKTAAIEFGYALCASGVINNGNIDIREIMSLIETVFNIELGDYYRAYLALKNRKKERAAFLKLLADNLIKRMDEDFDS
jgi:hypothetical protein